ncbi:MAG: hypothetical protein A3G24_16130 [Betaproteobacteria bacterium RIFCSPLOWO2_12_FULL_62_13]|nr:MAG: hypothetical protein A3G24_16130 [Betaproteobacteria bacterium RIFCSPLOWO2_12_FULL_62_13]
MGATEQLAAFAIDTPGDFLDPGLVESVKEKFLDTIGISVAGAHSPAGRIAFAAIAEMGGHAEATIIGRADKSSSVHAGFVNGVSAHALEYDDNTRNAGHISACLVPGCLAVAEKLNLSGRELVEAFVIGFEISYRIGSGLKPFLFDRGWNPTGLVGGQGVAAASCRMMGLDKAATQMAMGIMASSGTGLRKNVGSMGKAFHVGNGVRAGIFAAIMARHGFQVDPDIIEGSDEGGGEGHQRFGLVDAFAGTGNYRADRMVGGLGGGFELCRDTTMVRMHPGSTVIGAAIDGIIDLAVSHDITAAEVDEIHVGCHPRMLAIASYTEPSDGYRAKFCPPYIFAVALIDRKVGVAQYSDYRIRDHDVLDVMRRIKVTVCDDLKDHRGQWGEGGINWGEARIAIKLRDGRVLRKDCATAKGWPGQRASWGDLCGKYEECTEKILSRAQVLETIEMIQRLPELASVRDLTRTLMTRSLE